MGKLQNLRSFIYIDNLCSFVKMCIDDNLSGLFFPQNRRYMNTTKMAEWVAMAMNKKMYISKSLGVAVKPLQLFFDFSKKAFGSLRKKIGSFGLKQISISFLKILFVSLVMGLLAKLSYNCLRAFLAQSFSLLLAIGVGAVSYFVIIYFMKIEEFDLIIGTIKRKAQS